MVVIDLFGFLERLSCCLEINFNFLKKNESFLNMIEQYLNLVYAKFIAGTFKIFFKPWETIYTKYFKTYF